MLQTLLRTCNLCPMPLLAHKIIRISMKEIKSHTKSTLSKANYNAHIRARVLGYSCRMTLLLNKESLLMLREALPWVAKSFTHTYVSVYIHTIWISQWAGTAGKSLEKVSHSHTSAEESLCTLKNFLSTELNWWRYYSNKSSAWNADPVFIAK